MTLFTADNIRIDVLADEQDHRPLLQRVINGVSFDLEGGCIYDLTGESGSGKSTLLRACALMAPYVSGSFSLNGRPQSSFTPTAWRKAVCLVPQKPSLVPGTVRDNLLLPWSLAIRKNDPAPSDGRMRDALHQAGMDDVSLDREASRLSGGQTARVALLRAFLTQPTVLLLDEVDAALDDASVQAVSAMTRALVDDTMTCLRVRHRRSDGLACATLHLKNGQGVLQ